MPRQFSHQIFVAALVVIALLSGKAQDHFSLMFKLILCFFKLIPKKRSNQLAIRIDSGRAVGSRKAPVFAEPDAILIIGTPTRGSASRPFEVQWSQQRKKISKKIYLKEKNSWNRSGPGSLLRTALQPGQLPSGAKRPVRIQLPLLGHQLLWGKVRAPLPASIQPARRRAPSHPVHRRLMIRFLFSNNPPRQSSEHTRTPFFTCNQIHFFLLMTHFLLAPDK